MTLEEAKYLAQQGEGLRIEFKHKAADPQKIMREVVAFSNTSGGWLLVGVDDDGTVRGVKDAEEEAFALEEAIAQFCSPLPAYQLYRVPINRKRTLLAMKVKESPHKPLFVIYNQRRGTGRAYFRVADRSIQASKELRRILKLQRQLYAQPFSYGTAEQMLMTYLRSSSHITVAQFATLANISIPAAADVLVQLTVAKVLQIWPQEGEDQYGLLTA